MKPTKHELRQTLKRIRLEMLEEERLLASRAIVGRLNRLIDWSAVKSLHFFEPVQQLNEVDIREFITGLEDRYPDLQLGTSRLIGKTWELISIRTGPPPDTFDVIIVPMLGFDPASRQRIGYGGGYYDKFLAAQPQARKIGVCFDAGKTGRIPVEAYDIAMDMIVTEKTDYM
ncbi:MAG TPA: 5-formyltetrahydrofolate cyclo-ligase [Candidatus Saccharimonadales bacterium]